jgi:hypothetical protein
MSKNRKLSSNLSEPLMEGKTPADVISEMECEKQLDPYQPFNISIFASYLAVGFGLYFILTPVQFYMVDTLDAPASQQAVVTGLLQLPWALKIFCGFITDSFPIMGLRRIPYFAIGWILFVSCNLILAIIGEPSIKTLSLFLFLMQLSFVQADVCTDAMIVERSKKYESEENRGTLQAFGYITRFFGGIIGAVAGSMLYNKGTGPSNFSWGIPMWAIFVVNAAVPILIILPVSFNLVEVKSEEPPALKVQIASIWELVQRKAVWQPCTFIYIFNVLLLTNPAWNSFLVKGLDFTNFDIGLLTVAGTVLSYVALVIYKNYLFETSWRKIYLGATFISFMFSCLQLVLVFGLNKDIGMNSPGYELLFAMGSYGVVQFVVAIQFLPACRMFLGMCPEGAEGASYAMLTTLSNLAGTVAYSVAAAFTSIWDVSNEELSAHNYDGMWKLTLLCGCIQLTGLFFLPLLPSGVTEQMTMKEVKSKTAGIVFVAVVTISLIFVIGFTLMTIIG